MWMVIHSHFAELIWDRVFKDGPHSNKAPVLKDVGSERRLGRRGLRDGCDVFSCFTAVLAAN